MKDTLRSLLGNRGSDRRVSLHVSLGLLVSVCVVPAVIVISYFLYNNYHLQQTLILRDTEILTREVAADLERELSAIESGLRVLSTSDALARGDLHTFHTEATNALRSQVVYAYILTDSQGRQVVNTLKPYGTPLPAVGTPPALASVFETGHTVLTDLFVGPVTHQYAVALGVPVTDERGNIRYSLNVGLTPGYLNTLLRRHNLPDGWLVAIVDSSGTIVARSRDANRYVGEKAVDAVLQDLRLHNSGWLNTVSKDGVPIVSAYIRLRAWGWAVVAGAPREHLEAENLRTTGTVVATLALCFFVASVIAYLLARQVLSTVEFLNNAALALKEGKPLQLPPVQLKEAEAIGQAIVQASHLMAEVHHRAYHDPLTELGNRDLFYAVLHHQLAESERGSRHLALLSMDLDNFKQVNDNEGHGAGDLLLKSVAQRITAIVRGADVAVRIGGDEFCVLLVDSDSGVAIDIAQRLVHALAQPFEGVRTRIAVSIGIATFPQCGTDQNTLMEAADKALYTVKRRGRNGFALAPQATVPPQNAADLPS